MPNDTTTTTRFAHPLALPEAGDGPQTMSTQEIADLTGKTLKNVIRDVKRMAKSLYGDGSILIHTDAPPIPGIAVERDGRGYVTQVHLDRDHTMTMVTGYDVALRHRIMKRWAELERAVVAAEVSEFQVPTTLREALLLAAAQEEEIERHRALAEAATARAIETERRKAEIGSRREATAMSTASAAKRETEKLKIQLDLSMVYATVRKMEGVHRKKFPWQPLKAASAEMGLEVRNVPDERYGKLNSYHSLVWQKVYGIEIPAWTSAEDAE